MRRLRNLVCTSVGLVVGLLVVMAPALALASPIFPDAIDTDLKLDYQLGTTHCTICHENNSGGVGTATSKFAVAMKSAGLVLENTTSLQAALNMLDADKTDSDCDGVPDIEQIQNGRDPNTGAFINGSTDTPPAEPGCGADAGTSTSTPAYGCAAQLAPGAVTSWGSAVGLLGFAAAISGIRRSRPRRRSR